jgi:hypothetical protein
LDSEIEVSIQAQLRKSIKPDFVYATVVYSIVFFFITLTFPNYFYFLPSAQDQDIRPLLLGLYLGAWPLAVILPPFILIFVKKTGFTRFLATMYLLSVLLWPVITLLIKIRSLIAYGTASTEYWGLYPIFILLEILWPISVVIVYFIWQRVPSASKINKKIVKRQIREQYKSQLAAATSTLSAN